MLCEWSVERIAWRVREAKSNHHCDRRWSRSNSLVLVVRGMVIVMFKGSNLQTSKNAVQPIFWCIDDLYAVLEPLWEKEARAV